MGSGAGAIPRTLKHYTSSERDTMYKFRTETGFQSIFMAPNDNDARAYVKMWNKHRPEDKIVKAVRGNKVVFNANSSRGKKRDRSVHR
jgi:hypothetical protein